jgi:hypothetical protein
VQYQDWLEGQGYSYLSQRGTESGPDPARYQPKELFELDIQPQARKPCSHSKEAGDNIEGLQYLHSLLLDSPWEEPVKLDDLLLRLVKERDPVTYGQAISKMAPERLKAKAKIRVNISAIN